MGASDPLVRTARVRRQPKLRAFRRVWPLAVALVVIAAGCSGLASSKHGRAAYTAALVLPDMMVELPVRPTTWFTPAPVVTRTLIEYDSGRIVADIYLPSGDGPHAVMIFSMGAPPLELDDGRLVNLAEAVARGGLVMVVPYSTRLAAERIELVEIDALVGVFEYLEEQAYVDPERIGYLGLSVGGSLALLAAADERIAERVDYVVAFGAYYNAVDALVAVGSRTATYDGNEESWEPRAHAIEVMALQLIVDLADRDDRETLCKAFVDPDDRKLCGGGRESVSSGEIARLTAEGRAVYRLMTSEDPTEARELLGRLPAATLERLERLSPSQTIERLQGELFIIHDRGDEFIPYVESRRLRDALSGRENVHFTELQLFDHVRPRLTMDGGVIVLDLARVYYLLYQLLLRLS